MQIKSAILVTLLSVLATNAASIHKRDDRHIKIGIPENAKLKMGDIEKKGQDSFTFNIKPDTDPKHGSTSHETREFDIITYVPGTNFAMMDTRRACSLKVFKEVAAGDVREYDIGSDGIAVRKDNYKDSLILVECKVPG